MVASAQTDTEHAFTARLEAATVSGRAELDSVTARRSQHIAWWDSFFNRSYIHIVTDDVTDDVAEDAVSAPPDDHFTGAAAAGDARAPPSYSRHDRHAGDQQALMRNPA